MRTLTLGCLAAAMLIAAFCSSPPASAKSPGFSVTLAASPASYSGPCPATIKFAGEISGAPGDKFSYQIARIVGGVPTTLAWTVATLPGTGKFAVPDTITVAAPQAGVETEALRVHPGIASASVKVLVSCLAAKPTSSPTSTPTSPPTKPPTSKPAITLANPGLTTIITPAPSPSSKAPPGVIMAPSIGLAAPKPPRAPINLTQAITKEACQAHGGSAGSFACYIGLPAGKLALVWDYPFSNPIDGYNIYTAAGPAPSGPMILHTVTVPKPIASQSDPAWKFVIIDPPKPGACFAVTAFKGKLESDQSVRFCLGAGGIAKIVSLDPDRMGAAVWDTFYDPHEEVWKQSNVQPSLRDLLSLVVGFSHDASTWRDQAHTDVASYDNSLFRGYVHFNTSSLSGHHIAQAQLHLQSGKTRGVSGGQTCLAYWGAADRLWNPGDKLNATSRMGNGYIQGPDIRLDVTTLAQSWADSPGTNLGIALDSEQRLVIYEMVIMSSTCLTEFSSATLDVTYY